MPLFNKYCHLKVGCTTEPAITTNDGINEDYAEKKPKYIFLFIGDGMGTAQNQLTQYYNRHVEK